MCEVYREGSIESSSEKIQVACSVDELRVELALIMKVLLI